MQQAILQVNHLSKNYGSQTAVQDISFEIQAGEVFGLLGPNGAGKSTTISILTGVMAQTGGEVQFDGRELREHLNWAKQRIGYVPQDLALYPTLSAADNLNFFGRIYGFRGNDLKSRISEVLEIVQLSDRANDRVETFSGGMKRRVNMAIGLLHRPRILFLDEPTVGVDPQSRNAIFESLEHLNSQGLTIVYTTHYMEEAERLCDRVAIIDHGRIIALDTPAGLIQTLGEGMIHIELGDGQAEAVGQEIRNLGSVDKVNQRGPDLEIHSSNFEQTIIETLQIATRFNTRVTSLNIMNASLETVFLNLTGKSIRE